MNPPNVELTTNQQTRELQEIELAIAKDTPANSGNNCYLPDWQSELILQVHNPHILALIERRYGLVERTEVVSDSDGMDINDLRELYCFGDNDQCHTWLESIGINDRMWVNLPNLPSPKLPRSLLPWLDEQWSQQKGTRQLLIGE